MSAFIPATLLPALPELALLLAACVLLLVEAMSSDAERPAVYWTAQVSLLIAAWLVLDAVPADPGTLLQGHFVSDMLAVALKVAVLGISALVFFYAREYLLEHGLMRGEFYVLGLFAVLGMMILISAGSLLTVYLGLELLSLSLYAMVALNRDSALSSEAAMKYFVLGALASGMLLYGMSMLYGVTGTLELAELARLGAAPRPQGLFVVFGLVFVIVGIGFKLGAVPFHTWVPDVYQGSPTAVTMFVSGAPKIAAFAMAVRLLVDGMPGLLADWQGMLIILALLSISAGNIIAIAQSNIKRMLAYSTIAHVGFLLLGLLSGTAKGYAGAMFYVLVYALMSVGAFAMIMLLGRQRFEADELDDFQGLSKRSTWFAFMMLILMFSLAGVPPFAGFWAKWFVLKEVVAAGHVWLAALAVLFSVIGAYYYLRVVKLMYFDEPTHMTALKASPPMRAVLSANGLAVLLLGVWPGALMALCIAVF
jgi:NADH-quinone oxidoreductase subunit N